MRKTAKIEMEQLHNIHMFNEFSRRYIVLVLTIVEEFYDSNPDATDISGNTALIEAIYSQLHDAPESVN